MLRPCVVLFFWTLLWTLGWTSGVTVEITSQSAFGSNTDRSFHGVLSGVSDATQYTVISAIQGGNWWGPKTYVVPKSDGTFVGSVGSATNDKYGVRIALWVFANTDVPAYGDISILNEPVVTASTITGDNSTVQYFKIVDRFVQYVRGGYGFGLKTYDSRVGPGDNYFGYNSDLTYHNDSDDSLHLYIYLNETSGQYYCTEYYGLEPLGYGSYIFSTKSRVDLLADQGRWSVLGMFTYDETASETAYNEVDFEVSKWGYSADPTNAQFVIQPYGEDGHLKRFTIPHSNSSGSLYDELTLIDEYNFTDSAQVPPPGNTTVHINLWTANHTQQDVQQTAVISGFWHFDTPFYQLQYIPTSTVQPASPASSHFTSFALCCVPLLTLLTLCYIF
ncbi:hypothetical protein RFI_04155 [Reticulomyxa filosa]|uniref:GH16 domain-containing protein n=1 Tax=Reticulomyxa filosa TaxID=46433 RepID=X6P4F8_RETFI|nr:hypothetical protein RFI_04155 [Reticulomyxa filosa]|eukprot:ETO32954.1 hypothetical protein RFI_04155 [Reticulomyxa filosa]